MIVGVRRGGVVISLEIGLCYTNRDKLRPCDLMAWSAPLPFFLLLIANWSTGVLCFLEIQHLLDYAPWALIKSLDPRENERLFDAGRLLYFHNFQLVQSNLHVRPPLVSDHLP